MKSRTAERLNSESVPEIHLVQSVPVYYESSISEIVYSYLQQVLFR